MDVADSCFERPFCRPINNAFDADVCGFTAQANVARVEMPARFAALIMQLEWTSQRKKDRPALGCSDSIWTSCSALHSLGCASLDFWLTRGYQFHGIDRNR